jgi:hypothetical protein
MRWLYALLILLSLIVGSCSTIQMRSPALPKIITASDCEPPCWYSITPGVTTKEEVITLLNANPIVKSDSIQVWENQIGAHTDPNSGSTGVLIHFDDNEVVKVISISNRVKQFTLENVVSYYGEPDYAIAVQGPSFRYGFRVHLIYRDRGIAFGSARRPFDSAERQAEINENYQVGGVYFFTPLLLNEVFTDFTISNYSKELFRSGLREWQGFGEIEPVFELDYR